MKSVIGSQAKLEGSQKSDIRLKTKKDLVLLPSRRERIRMP